MSAKLLKRADIILAAIITVICALWLFFGRFSADGQYAVIYENGRETMKIDLSDLQKTETFELKETPGVTIGIKNGEVFFEESCCKDEICVKTGAIKRSGSSAVCVPQKVALVVLGSDNELDAITY